MIYSKGVGRMKQLSVVGAAVLLVLGVAASSFGAGFAVIEQSVSGLGNAFAGAAASAEDPTTIFYNPAGMTRLKGQQATAGMHVIFPQSDFKDDGSSAVSPLLGGGALTGGDGGNGGEAVVVPNAYYSINFDNGWVAGLGINSPYGLVTEWGDGWQGRYHALRSDVLTVNINPSVAYKVNDHFSVGVGVSAQYVDAELSQAIDFGSIAYATSGFNSALSGLPQNRDGKVTLEADDWAYGFNLGALIEVDENTRFGIAYRSEISYTAEGDADYEVPNVISGDPLLDGGIKAAFSDVAAKADLDLPATASASVYHRFNDQWAVMADATWTEWSSFDELRVKFADGRADAVTTENWNDSWRYSAGLTYSPSEALDLRFGLAYDETPIPDDYRTPRIPGDNRIWVATGLGYAWTSFKLDVGYAHLFVDNARSNRQAGVDPLNGEDFFKGTLSGEYESSVDIASVQLTYLF
ncbi:hypothetical protein C2E25_11730 [Geothermobacter hydrogeniphilus]|uniref:Long-chain fatty acid transport protein n=2 Tax=Geothermobacter hydrogeniphilus TaxID=1969733 RepID=A0A2K2H8F4_9BACT|nr:hypothetical protein C2E25_11730 [Geothermobacter hydrogeniphilus]